MKEQSANPRETPASEGEIHLPPSAPDLLESMRAIGYSFEAALADLIDNSIAAGARNVNIRFSANNAPYIAVIDDGAGMSPQDLTDAMRHGSRNPGIRRDALDLGRFGLGLKTASLSQCRTLTVVSLRDGVVSARRWDLDYIARRRDWWLLNIPEDQARLLPHVDDLIAQQPFSRLPNLAAGIFDRLVPCAPTSNSSSAQSSSRSLMTASPRRVSSIISPTGYAWPFPYRTRNSPQCCTGSQRRFRSPWLLGRHRGLRAHPMTQRKRIGIDAPTGNESANCATKKSGPRSSSAHSAG